MDLYDTAIRNALRNFMRENADALEIPEGVDETDLDNMANDLRRELQDDDIPRDLSPAQYEPLPALEYDAYDGPWAVRIEPVSRQSFIINDGIFAYGGAWPKLSESVPSLDVSLASDLGITTAGTWYLYAKLSYGGPRTQGYISSMAGGDSSIELEACATADEDDARRSHPGDVFQRQVLGTFTTASVGGSMTITEWDAEWEYGNINRSGTLQGCWLPTLHDTTTMRFINPYIHVTGTSWILEAEPNPPSGPAGLFDFSVSAWSGTHYVYLRSSIDPSTGVISYILWDSNLLITDIAPVRLDLVAAVNTTTAGTIREVVPMQSSTIPLLRYAVRDPFADTLVYHLKRNMSGASYIYDLSGCATGTPADTVSLVDGAVTHILS
jgi:hypothetical protein